MTLKAFHVVFITVATLAAGGFGVWSFNAYGAGGQALHLFLGVFSVATAAALLVYGNWFLKKMKDVSYL